MSVIRLQEIHKRYGSVHAVKGISFSVQENEFLVLLGPSGAGKTSTLKMIAGLEPVTQGAIRVRGRLLNFVPPEDRRIAMVFESYALYPHLTVFENIAFPLRSKHHKISETELCERIAEIAALLQIEPLLTRKPAELSGGQKQRISLGRALVRRAEILLMDEPLAHLDAKLRHDMRRELKKYQSSLNTSVIYVTHDYLEALSLADRIIVLNEGLIHQTGLPNELYHQPKDTLVASLLGQPKINLIACQIRNTNGALFLHSADGGLQFPCPEAFAHRTKRHAELLVGIRPQFIALSPDPHAPGIAGQVYLSENIGAKCIVGIKVAECHIKAITRDCGYHAGQQVRMQFAENRLLLFDRRTGENIIQA